LHFFWVWEEKRVSSNSIAGERMTLLFSDLGKIQRIGIEEGNLACGCFCTIAPFPSVHTEKTKQNLRKKESLSVRFFDSKYITYFLISISDESRLPAEFKQIIKRRKGNQMGFP